MPVVPPSAALAGVPAGVQGNGLWIGRRQLFVRFAAEAETATMYTPDALGSELARLIARSSYHSISVSGRDPLSNAAFLGEAFAKHAPALPTMLDCDGQRPEAIGEVARYLSLVQVTLENAPAGAQAERAVATLKAAAAASVTHALVLGATETTTDGQLLRIISQAHAASADTAVVIHPLAESTEHDRRWLTFMEQAVALHGDVRLLPRLSRPTGMR
jgi:hypothetical protein